MKPSPPDYFNSAKEDRPVFNYLKSLPPLETNKYGASLNSLAMDSSPPTSFSYVLYDPMRNNPFYTSMPEHFSEDANKIHSHQEADKVIPAEDYSPELSCVPEHHPLISSDDHYYLLDFLGMPVPNGTYVQDGSLNDSVGGNYIQEVGQIEANIEVPVEGWNDKVVCNRRHIQGLALDRHCLENNMTINSSNISSYTTKTDEWNANNQICPSTHIMPFQDLTNKQLNLPNLKRKRTGQIDLDASCLTHENKEEENTDFCQSIPTNHNSDLTGEGGTCNNCKCKKSQCLKLYCGCFAAGVYCTGPCSCQNCLNKPINKDIVMEARKKIVPKVEDRNKSGCNCRKSSCMNKYCECFKGGVGCSPSCNCRGCENIRGRKIGDCIVWKPRQEPVESNAIASITVPSHRNHN